MRVLMLSDVYFPRINGVSTSIETFREALCERAVSSVLLAPAYGDDPELSDVIRIDARCVPGDHEDRLVHYTKMRRTALARATACDIIHVQTPFAAHYAGVHAARKLGKPIVATYHTLFEEYLQHYIPWLPASLLRGLARRFSRAQCNTLDAVIVPSAAMRDRLLAYGVSRPMHVLPTGLPESIFVPGKGLNFRTSHGISPERPVALFVGRVAHEKNIRFLLDVVGLARQTVPDLLLLITGEGPARPDLENQVCRMGLSEHVRFLGYMDRHGELPAAYAAADVFVFASRTETQGLVLLEAMAQRCPVVALSVMGTADILEPRKGCRIAPEDPAGFAGVLTQLLNDPEACLQLGEEARTYALTWSDREMARRLADLYRSLAS